MSLRPSYPDVAHGQGGGWKYIHVQTGAEFTAPVLTSLHAKVSEFCKANGFMLNNDEFDENVCKNTINVVCTDSPRGAGDIIHSILNPISKLIDEVVGTNTQGCTECYKRQNTLNK